jgi:hypothetical protein
LLCLPPAFMLVSCLALSSIVRMVVPCFSNMSADFQQATQCYIPEGKTIHVCKTKEIPKLGKNTVHFKFRYFWQFRIIPEDKLMAALENYCSTLIRSQPINRTAEISQWWDCPQCDARYSDRENQCLLPTVKMEAQLSGGTWTCNMILIQFNPAHMPISYLPNIHFNINLLQNKLTQAVILPGVHSVS